MNSLSEQYQELTPFRRHHDDAHVQRRGTDAGGELRRRAVEWREHDERRIRIEAEGGVDV